MQRLALGSFILLLAMASASAAIASENLLHEAVFRPASNCQRALVAAEQAELDLMSHSSVVAIVEDEPISNYELRQRIAWDVAVADKAFGTLSTDQIKVREIQRLKNELRVIQAARKRDVTVSSSEVDAYMAKFLARHALAPKDLDRALSRAGVTLATLRAIMAKRIISAKMGMRTDDDLGVSASNCLNVSQ